ALGCLDAATKQKRCRHFGDTRLFHERQSPSLPTVIIAAMHQQLCKAFMLAVLKNWHKPPPLYYPRISNPRSWRRRAFPALRLRRRVFAARSFAFALEGGGDAPHFLVKVGIALARDRDQSAVAAIPDISCPISLRVEWSRRRQRVICAGIDVELIDMGLAWARHCEHSSRRYIALFRP